MPQPLPHPTKKRGRTRPRTPTRRTSGKRHSCRFCPPARPYSPQLEIGNTGNWQHLHIGNIPLTPSRRSACPRAHPPPSVCGPNDPAPSQRGVPPIVSSRVIQALNRAHLARRDCNPMSKATNAPAADLSYSGIALKILFDGADSTPESTNSGSPTSSTCFERSTIASLRSK